MKIFIIVIFSWLSTYSTTGKPMMSVQTSDDYKIDSVFNYNMTLLERFLKDTRTDSTLGTMTAIHILEHMTGITSSGTMTYFGKIGFREEDLCKWRAWYAK